MLPPFIGGTARAWEFIALMEGTEKSKEPVLGGSRDVMTGLGVGIDPCCPGESHDEGLGSGNGGLGVIGSVDGLNEVKPCRKVNVWFSRTLGVTVLTSSGIYMFRSGGVKTLGILPGCESWGVESRYGLGVLIGVLAGLLISVESCCFLLRRDEDSFAVLSSTILAIRSNSEQMLSIRRTPPFSSSVHKAERKLTTMFISFKSEFARESCGFCNIFAKSVTSADTG
jgi:hypothetical protein